MEKEPRRHFVQNCLHSTFAVEQLPIHFLRVSCMEKRNIEKSSITASVSDVLFSITYQIQIMNIWNSYIWTAEWRNKCKEDPRSY